MSRWTTEGAQPDVVPQFLHPGGRWFEPGTRPSLEQAVFADSTWFLEGEPLRLENRPVFR